MSITDPISGALMEQTEVICAPLGQGLGSALPKLIQSGGNDSLKENGESVHKEG